MADWQSKNFGTHVHLIFRFDAIVSPNRNLVVTDWTENKEQEIHSKHDSSQASRVNVSQKTRYKGQIA